jgi:hypothetical protein
MGGVATPALSESTVEGEVRKLYAPDDVLVSSSTFPRGLIDPPPIRCQGDDPIRPSEAEEPLLEGWTWVERPRVKEEKAWWPYRVLPYLPVVSWLPHYSRHALWGDLLGGLTVAVMVVPQVGRHSHRPRLTTRWSDSLVSGRPPQGMSYALLADLTPVYGLFCALTAPVVYAFLGTSRHLSIGPVALVRRPDRHRRGWLERSDRGGGMDALRGRSP